MIKLIVTDMDGTLLNTNKELPADFNHVYAQLKAKGIRLVVASGRQYYVLHEEFKELDHDIIFVAENGGFIKDGEAIRMLNPFTRQQVEDMVTTARAVDGAFPVLCGKNGAYVESNHKVSFEMVEKFFVRYHFVDDLLAVQDDLLKIAVCDLTSAEHNCFPHFKPFVDQLQICVSDDMWMDIMPLGVNKGEAIKLVQQQLGISPDETMVFGDYLNDLEMMQTSHYSYAMANAHPDLKKVARFEADSNDNNGVLNKIRETVLV
ncbi:HAD family phosphatase [Marinilabiliaceae bacterium JC017]|nr:HAD family phosphatase [Marinilabiliaceae bacterium JC017]